MSDGLLRSKNYQPRSTTQHFRQSRQGRTVWLNPDRSEADKPLHVGPTASTQFADIVRAAAADVIDHGEALGGDPSRDSERWVHEYLDAHHLLQADFLCEVYDAAIRSAVAACLKARDKARQDSGRETRSA